MAFSYQGISYKTRENVVDISPIQRTADRTRTLPLSPIVGGITWLAMGKKKA